MCQWAKVCTFGVFSLGNLSSTLRDAYGPGCGCTAGKLGLQVTQFNEFLTEKDRTDQMANISAHGPNKVLCFGLTGDSTVAPSQSGDFVGCCAGSIALPVDALRDEALIPNGVMGEMCVGGS